MKQLITWISAVLVAGAMLLSPQRANAQALQKFCSVVDAQLSQDLATAAASLLALHGSVGMTCSYMVLTMASQKKADNVLKVNQEIATVSQRLIKASRGFFKVMVPSSEKAYNALKSHNEYIAKVFRGNLVDAFKSTRIHSEPSINACKTLSQGFYKLRAGMIVVMGLLATAKAVCATAKAIDPHCKNSSQHKNRCSVPVFNEHSIIPSNVTMTSTPANGSCNAARNQKLTAYLNLATQYSSQLSSMSSFIKTLKTQLRPLVSKFRSTQTTASSVSSGLNGLKSGFQRLNSVFSTLNSGLNPLRSLINKSVCVTIKVPGKKKKCKKVKIPGKKKKKQICTWKPTMTNKKICSSVKNISKMAATVQKPMDQMVDAMAKPILNLLPKSFPLPGVAQAKNLANRLRNSLNISGVSALNNTLNRASGFTSSLNNLKTSLQSIRNGM